MQTEVKSVQAPVVSHDAANAEVSHVTRQGDADVKVHQEGGAAAAVTHHVTGRERGIDRAAAEIAKLQSAGTEPGPVLTDGETAADRPSSPAPAKQSDFHTKLPKQ